MAACLSFQKSQGGEVCAEARSIVCVTHGQLAMSSQKVRVASICEFARDVSAAYGALNLRQGKRGSQRRRSEINVLANTTSFRMIAVSATLGGFPFRVRLRYISPYAPRRLIPETAHM